MKLALIVIGIVIAALAIAGVHVGGVSGVKELGVAVILIGVGAT